jgi:hypothetical protein
MRNCAIIHLLHLELETAPYNTVSEIHATDFRTIKETELTR